MAQLKEFCLHLLLTPRYHSLPIRNNLPLYPHRQALSYPGRCTPVYKYTTRGWHCAFVHAFLESLFEKPINCHTLQTLLKLVLELIKFEFNRKHFVQVNDTSMGTKVDPNYANIFMGILESEFLKICALKRMFYRRFIDDVFLMWSHGEEELLKFISQFNAVHPTISFSRTHSASVITFRGVSVSVHNKFITSVYKKPTDKHKCLHFHSNHVKHCKTAIPYSQSLRLKRI